MEKIAILATFRENHVIFSQGQAEGLSSLLP
jgi:hypothetical protein